MPTPVTAVVCTRGRPDSVYHAVESILKNDYPEFRLLVVDQSPDTLTEASLRRFRSDPRFHLERSTTRGIAAARNVGLRLSKTELVAMTDDDCVAGRTWLQEMTAALEFNPRVGLVLGNVSAAPFDASAGLLPSYTRESPFLARSLREKHQVEGIGASMGIRRSVWRSLGGFDELLGTGARLRSGEDTDFAIRILLAGYYLYEPAGAGVLHYGFRTWAEAGSLIEGYLTGLAATLMKHAKAGRWSVLDLYLRLAWRWAFCKPVVDLGPNTSKGLRLRAFLKGTLTGAALPIDARRGLYRSPSRRGPASAGPELQGAASTSPALAAAIDRVPTA